jgi:hypothetical protein
MYFSIRSALGPFSILTAEEATVDCHGAPASCQFSAVPSYLKLIRSMGVGPCEWSEVKTFSRIPRQMVKGLAGLAVLVASAVPLVALAGPASAATAPTLTCSIASNGALATPPCTNGYAIVGQGFAGNFAAVGTGFANDQAVGGNVTLTTTATGVTFSDIVEGATAITASITTSSTTAPGFYPVTMTDDSGTATFPVGLGIDNGPQITTIAGNVGTVGASTSTVTVTGTGLEGATVAITPTAGPTPAVTAVVSNNAGTSLSFNVSNALLTPGADALTISGTQGGENSLNAGVATSSYTVNAAATALSITSVTPSELGVPSVNSSTVTVTVSGTGFELGAVLTIGATTGVSVANPTFVNSTTMTEQVTVASGAPANQLPVSIVNPDTTFTVPADLIGINEAASANSSGPAAPVAPALSLVSGVLEPGTASIIHVTGTATFPMTTASTVTVKHAGVTNVSESLVGKVVSVDASNDATIQVQVPRYATAVTTAAVVKGATTFTLTDASGISNAAGLPATIVDGAATEQVVGTLTGNSFAITGPAVTEFAHAAGVTVEFPFPAQAQPVVAGFTNNVLTVSNGSNTESSNVAIYQTVGTGPYPVSAYTASNTGATVGNLDPGTYSINAYLPGFGFATGSAVTFQSFTTAGVPDSDGVTGTVTVVNGNTATLAVTVPKIRSGDTGEQLVNSATPGQNAITLPSVINHSVAGNPNILVGDSLTIQADAFFTTPETVTVTSVTTVAGNGVIGITPALADSHTGGAAGVGAEVIDNSDPQSINDRVQATITNGAGVVEVNPSFFTFHTAGLISSTQLATANTVVTGPGVAPFGASNLVGAGANGATINLLLSQTTDGSAPADWTGTSTNAGVTFGPITNDTGLNITTTINVAAGTPASASVPISFTDGLETYSGTIAIVAGPTVSAVTTVGNLTAGGTETIGVTGTNFVDTATTTAMTCSTSDPTVVCGVTANSPTNTSTTATVVLTAAPGMLNGSFSLTLTYSSGIAATYGAGSLAGAFTVSGQPTFTAIAPTSIAAVGAVPSVATPLVLTGTLLPTGALTVCNVAVTHPSGTTDSGTCTAVAAPSSTTTIDITSLTYPTYTINSGGDSLVFTVGTATATANSPAVLVVTNPAPTFMVNGGVLNNFTADGSIAANSTGVPFYIIGAGYSAGATVSFATVSNSANAGTATITSVTPNAVYGTVAVPAQPGVTLGQATATVTNPNAGAGSVLDGYNVVAAPVINSPAAPPVAPKPILDGVPTTITISGTGFIVGAVVSGAVAGVDTFGPATVSQSNNPLAPCKGIGGPNVGTCDTIKVLVTPVSFSGSTPILDGLVVTNPVGGGAVTVNNNITVNPVPAVTGVYYVPTFTANREITITGSGFETGIAASSANPDYTVLAVASTPTTVTLLVTTDSNATAGTSSTVTLTNPDTGSGTFTLNGGPNPNTATPTPKATAAHGVAHLGKTSTVTISGTHFYGQPKVTSNNPGVKVTVNGDSGKTLTLHITSKKTSKKGVHTLTITFKNGESTHVKYNTTK